MCCASPTPAGGLVRIFLFVFRNNYFLPFRLFIFSFLLSIKFLLSCWFCGPLAVCVNAEGTLLSRSKERFLTTIWSLILDCCFVFVPLTAEVLSWDVRFFAERKRTKKNSIASSLGMLISCFSAEEEQGDHARVRVCSVVWKRRIINVGF